MVFNYFFVSCFNWGILLYNVVLVSAVQQSELAIWVCVCVCVCVCIVSLFLFPSHLGHHRALSRVPCLLYSRF